jgi:hypothetical protein
MDRRNFLTWMSFGAIAATFYSELNPSMASSEQSFNSLEPIIFHISPLGQDSWSGKLTTPNKAKTDGPFATLSKARDAIRELKNLHEGQLPAPVIVFLQGGTYYLTEPLTFLAEDSGTPECPIIWTAAPQQKPIISGGRPITGWQQRKENLWVANLPDVKSGKWYFRLLRVNQDWAVRARYPKFDPDIAKGWLYATWFYGQKWWRNPWERGAFNNGVTNIHNIGDRLEWPLIIPATAAYKVWIRYSQNMKEPMDERTAIRMGNNNRALLKNLPDTDGWDNFRWSETTSLELTKGETRLIWENLKGGGLSLDAFCLCDDPNWQPEAAIKLKGKWIDDLTELPAKDKHLLIVQAESCEEAIGKDIVVPDLPKDLPVRSGIRDRIQFYPDKFPNWDSWEGAEVHIFPFKGWVNTILKVEDVDKKELSVKVNCDQDIRDGNRFFIANVREALTNPNEWYLDQKTGELLYISDRDDFPNSDVVAPTLERLIVLQGNGQEEGFVEHIHFKGLTFTDTDYTLGHNYYGPKDSAIWLAASRQCTIEDCTFVNLGGYAVRMEQRSHENQIIGNKIAKLGQGGVFLVGKTLSQPFNNLIAANQIEDCGLIYKHVAGVYLWSGSNNRIIHNSIHRLPRYGISLKSLGQDDYSHNNVVEFNEIVDSNLETNDSGAIETLGLDRQLSGNIIRFNYIRNAFGIKSTPDGKMVSPDLTWGIYLDDQSSGTTIYGNIVINSAVGAVNIHGGQDNFIENNIFVNGLETQIWLQPRQGIMKGNVFRRNIFVYSNPSASLWHCWPDMWYKAILKECDFNLYWNNSELDFFNTEKRITPEGNLKSWQAASFDRNSLFANPLFVNFKRGDYRLKANSQAFKLGFKTIPIEKIGLQGFSSTNTTLKMPIN